EPASETPHEPRTPAPTPPSRGRSRRRHVGSSRLDIGVMSHPRIRMSEKCGSPGLIHEDPGFCVRGRRGGAMRVCSVAGCPTIYDGTGSRGPGHRKRADRDRGTAAERGYTGRGHRAFREEVLTRDPICVMCEIRQATVADHYPRSRRELVELGMDPND